MPVSQEFKASRATAIDFFSPAMKKFGEKKFGIHETEVSFEFLG